MAYNWASLPPDQLDYLTPTVYGEAADQPALGQQAVAAVIGNRMARNGGSAADTVLAPNQFEPWGTDAGRARMQGLDANGPQYAAIRNTILVRMQGDPTGGAMNFYAPAAQAQLGRAAPAWATGPYQEIGGHRFYGGNGSTVAASLAPIAGPAGPPLPNAARRRSYAPQPPQPPVSADYLARLEGYRKPGSILQGCKRGLAAALPPCSTPRRRTSVMRCGSIPGSEPAKSRPSFTSSTRPARGRSPPRPADRSMSAATALTCRSACGAPRARRGA